MGSWEKQTASRLGRSIVTQIATAQTNATQFTTPFDTQVRQVRIIHNFSSGIWAVIGSTQVVTANSAAVLLPNAWPEYFTVSPGQCLNFISTSTSTGYVVFSEMA